MTITAEKIATLVSGLYLNQTLITVSL